MSPRDDYFARVRPLLGEGLSRACVAVEDLALCSQVVELLCACMLQEVATGDPLAPARWPLVDERSARPRGASPSLAIEELRAQLAWNNPHHDVTLDSRAAVDVTLRGRRADAGAACCVHWDASTRCYTLQVPGADRWLLAQASYVAALDLREHLLGRRAIPAGTRHLGHPAWPFAPFPSPAPAWAGPSLRRLRGHVLIVGLGSVGSEVARVLAPSSLRFTLVDDGHVSVFNLVRQWFGADEVGLRKVEALATRIGRARCRALPLALGAGNLDRLQQLLAEDRPDLVVLATGTHDHAVLAETLWRARIPHVVACAYPQARFFEVNLVEPAVGTPCLHCFRGRLFAGPAAAPELPDELAHFLYRQVDDAERDRLYVDLVAEPATRIETGRIADVTALAAAELLQPPTRRSPWLARCFEQGTTCLLGGNTVVTTGVGTPAYGIEQPGQVLRLGLDDVVGSGEAQTCAVCGRQLRTALREELAQADDAAVDEALLAVG